MKPHYMESYYRGLCDIDLKWEIYECERWLVGEKRGGSQSFWARDYFPMLDALNQEKERRKHL